MDIELFLTLNIGMAHPILDWVATIISSRTFSFWIVISLLLVLFFVRDYDTVAIVFIALMSMILSDLTFGYLLKPYFAKPRPCLSQDLVRQVLNCSGYSFPSNHAGNAAAFATCFVLSRKRAVAALALTVMALVGWSRIYLGVHHPVDVLSGFAGGAVIAALFWTSVKYGTRS